MCLAVGMACAAPPSVSSPLEPTPVPSPEAIAAPVAPRTVVPAAWPDAPPPPVEPALGSPLGPLEGPSPVVEAPLGLGLELIPSDAQHLSEVRAVRIHVEAAHHGRVQLELATPKGTVYQHAAVDGAETEPRTFELLVAGTTVQQRLLFGTWSVTAQQADRVALAHFELVP